jgi:hypothetical protein
MAEVEVRLRSVQPKSVVLSVRLVQRAMSRVTVALRCPELASVPMVMEAAAPAVLAAVARHGTGEVAVLETVALQPLQAAQHDWKAQQMCEQLCMNSTHPRCFANCVQCSREAALCVRVRQAQPGQLGLQRCAMMTVNPGVDLTAQVTQ